MLNNTYIKNNLTIDTEFKVKNEQKIQEENTQTTNNSEENSIPSSPSLIPDDDSECDSFSESLDGLSEASSPIDDEKIVEEAEASNNKSPKNCLKPEKTLSQEDEQVLLKLVVKLKNSWKKIVKRFNKVQNKSVSLTVLRNRYNALAPRVLKRKGKFSHQEDLLLAKYFTEYGSNWEKISSQIKNRTPNMLKNRYYSHIRKRKLLNELLEELKISNGEVNTASESGENEISTGPNSPRELNSPTRSEIKTEVEQDFRKVEYENMIFFSMKEDIWYTQTIYIPEISLRLLELDGNEENELHTKITTVF